MGSVSSTSVSVLAGITQPVVENVLLATAATEVAHSLPADTKVFFIQARGNAKLQLSFDAGESGTVYHTIYPGSFYALDGISAPLVTLYLQSPSPGVVAEITSAS